MKRGIFKIGAVITALAISGPSFGQKPAKMPKQMQKLLAMTPDHFATCASLSDDSLDVVATISTEPCFQEKRGILKIVWNDNFIRAHVDKKTGKTSYQVYQYVMYDGDWRFYNTVNFSTPDGPISLPITEIARNVGSCSGARYSNGCTLIEHFAFPADEDLLRKIASKWEPGNPAVWRFKFGAKAAEDWQDGMAPGEVAGILKAVENYKMGHGVPPFVDAAVAE